MAFLWTTSGAATRTASATSACAIISTGLLERASLADDGSEADDHVDLQRGGLSDDGRWVVFETRARSWGSDRATSTSARMAAFVVFVGGEALLQGA